MRDFTGPDPVSSIRSAVWLLLFLAPMIHSGMSDPEMLGLAVELEEQALRRILELSGTLNDPSSAELLDLVAADRASHRDCLREEWVRLGAPRLPEADVTRWLFRDHEIVAHPSRETGYDAVFGRLRAIELHLRAFYRIMAVRTVRQELAALYLALAEVDGVHARDLAPAA